VQKKMTLASDATALRRRAEARMVTRRKKQQAGVCGPESAADTRRLLHELQVHQVELEMQNAELQESRDRAESLLEKFTDLYDFAPVGYLSLDQQGRILEVNLTGSALLGVERSRLVNRSLSRFVILPGRTAFLDFLARVFEGTGKEACETKFMREDGTPFWASLIGGLSASLGGAKKVCRVALSDITSFKQAQEAQRLLEALSVSNEELKKEIVQRQAVEKALKASEQHQCRLLEKSHRMQEQLRHLSHCIIQAREEERKRISRELHDDITQTLVGINVQLETLARDTAVNPRVLRQKIARTQRLVEKSVNAVHQFAVELRPTSLDDLGLIVTLHSCLNDFMKRTGIRVHFTTFAGVEQLNSDLRTVLYRITQEALANVAQHANASHVKVNIRKIGDSVHMEICDNGKSFDLEQALNARKSQRLGLLGMRERVEMVGGAFGVESAPGHGTTVRAQVPFHKRAKEQVRP